MENYSLVLILGTAATLMTLIGMMFFAYMYKAKSREFRLKIDNQQLKIQEKAYKGAMLAVEEERNRISRELHDQISSDLLVIKLGLQQLENNSLENSNIQIFELKDNVSKALIDVQNISRNLYPQTLEKYGIKYALEEVVNQYNKVASGLVISLECKINKLDRLESTLTYRVVQELLNNAVKHSKAKMILLKLEKRNNVFLTYKDDGIGIDKDKLKTGSGLLGIENRVKALGGKLLFLESPKGVSLVCQW